jgi:hypothetical protein
MTKYTHIAKQENQTGFGGRAKTLCGARPMLNAWDAEAISEALRRFSWLPPLCPKCAARQLIAETAVRS